MKWMAIAALAACSTDAQVPERPDVSAFSLPACAPARDALDTCLVDDALPLDACLPAPGTAGWTTYETCCSGQTARACDGTCASTVPASLTVVSDAALDAAALTYDASCTFGGTWCGMSGIYAYRLATCSDLSTAFDDIVTLALEDDRVFGGGQQGAWSFGAVVPVASLATHPSFSSTYSSGGPGVRALLEDHGWGGALAWSAEEEIPCPNCHEWYTKVILYWPMTGDVVVVDGLYGWDS